MTKKNRTRSFPVRLFNLCRLPDPPTALIWLIVLGDLAALAWVFAKVAAVAAAWFITPAGLACLLLANILVTILVRWLD